MHYNYGPSLLKAMLLGDCEPAAQDWIHLSFWLSALAAKTPRKQQEFERSLRQSAHNPDSVAVSLSLSTARAEVTETTMTLGVWLAPDPGHRRLPAQEYRLNGHRAIFVIALFLVAYGNAI
jgi:hypothetical protein